MTEPSTAAMAAPTRMRAEWASSLTWCIAQCDPHDAAQIMAAALRNMETEGPQHDVFGTLRRDARWWAELAPAHEVQAYVVEGLRHLKDTAIGRSARKEMIVALWNGMRADDKEAFLRAIGVANG